MDPLSECLSLLRPRSLISSCLDAGADYYLTKASFHDDTLVQAVIDLIGEAGG